MSDKKNFQVKNGISVNGTQVIDGNANATFGAVTVSGRELLNYTDAAYSVANSAYGLGVNNTNNIINVNLFAQSAYNKANTPWGYLANGSYTAVLNSSGQFILPNITTGGYTGGTMVSTQSFIMNAGGNLWAFDTAGQLISPYSVKITTGGIAWPDGSLQNTAAASLAYSQASFNKANNALANATGTFAGSLTTTGNVIINSGISSTSNTTGSLLVSGGAGITGNVYADKIFVNGLYWAANGNVISTGGSSSTNQFNIYKYLATAGQTVFSGPDSASVSLNYTPGAIIVTLNGLTLKPGVDYTATNGTSIVLTVAADLGDELNVYGFTTTVVSTNTITTYKYIANSNQTLIAGNDASGSPLAYTPYGLFVTLNGIVLKDTTDYSATTGNTITLTFNAAANDEVNIYAFNSIGIANTYTITQADAKFTTAGKVLAMNFFRS